MNNTEFKLVREELHLSQTELAELRSVSLRTVQRWERGDFQIPPDVQEFLKSSLNAVFTSVKQFLLILDGKAEKGETIVLLAYNSWSYDGDFPHYKIHNSMLIKAKEAAEAQGFKVVIVKFNPDSYAEWLGDKPDNQQNRALWAAFYYKV